MQNAIFGVIILVKWGEWYCGTAINNHNPCI
jgi:hypothetical protein